jgi:nucleoid-associated protein YgaU
VLGACGVALVACAVWLTAVVLVAATSLVAVELAPGRTGSLRLNRLATRACPALVRRGVATVLGVALGAGAAAAQGAPHAHQPPSRTGASVSARLVGLPLPDRVTGAGTRSVAPAVPIRARPVHRSAAVVTVHRGDSLWSITAALLGPGTSAADIDHGWRLLAARNTRRVGPDPDLIRPGLRLQVPALAPRP